MSYILKIDENTYIDERGNKTQNICQAEVFSTKEQALDKITILLNMQEEYYTGIEVVNRVKEE